MGNEQLALHRKKNAETGPLAVEKKWMWKMKMDGKKSRLLKFSVAALVAMAMIFMLFKTISPDSNYEISNVSKGKSAKEYMEIANTTLTRTRGLMFRDRIIPILFIFGNEGIYPIHSNFVKSEFDAIYLSPDGKVLEVFRKIPPNVQRVTPTKKALYLLELPVDVTDKLGISKGDALSWKRIDGK